MRCGRRRAPRRPCATATISRTAARCRSGSISPRSTASSPASTASIAAATAIGRRNGSRPATSIWNAGARRWRAVIRETAAQMLFSAAACYHLAGYMHHDIGRLLPETQRSMLRAVEIYWEAAPLFDPPAELAEVPFDDTTLRPFLRLPRGVAASALRDPDRRRQFQHDQHARGRGLLSRARHGHGRSRWAGAGRVPRAHRARATGA